MTARELRRALASVPPDRPVLVTSGPCDDLTEAALSTILVHDDGGIYTECGGEGCGLCADGEKARKAVHL